MTIHILLIKDRACAEQICCSLQSCPSRFRVDQVCSLAEARAYLKGTKPDLIMAGWLLPDGKGIALIMDKRAGFDVPVIILADSHDDQIASQAIDAGALDCIVLSPAALAAMPRIVDRVLRQWGYIDEYVRVEAALRESEERYRSLFNRVPVGLYRTTPGGQFLDANPALIDMLGFSDVESLKGVNVINLHLNPQDRRDWQALIEREGVVRSFCFQMRRQNGEVIWVEDHARTVRDRDGQVLCYEGHLRDVTAQHQANKALQHQIKELSVLQTVTTACAEIPDPDELIERVTWIVGEAFYPSNFGVMLVDQDAGILSDHPSYCLRKAGNKYTVRLGRGIVGTVAQTGEPCCVPDVRQEPRYVVGERHVQSELCVPLKVGERVIGVINTESHQLNAFTKEDERLLMTCAGQLATALDRLRAQEALRESEEQYRTLFEESQDCILITTPHSKILDINPAGVKLFGYDSKQALLQVDVARDLFDDPQEMCRYQNEISKQGFVQDYELVFKRQDGSKVIALMTANVVRGDGGDIVAYRGILRDVTQQRRLEQQLMQSQKMEAIGRLAGGVAHDFNNLLTAINGYGQILLSDLSPADSRRENVQEILEAASRAASLTRQLLIFSRKQVLQPQVVTLNELIVNIQRMLGRLIGEDIKLSTVLEKELKRIKADPGKMEQVVMNLVVNARDAMPDGGKLTIQTENVMLDREYCRVVPDARPGEFVCLSITDTGTGMSKEVKKHLFEPFFTTKEEGTGLGLSVVYSIVHQHDGWINVYSEPGQGATFRVYLPALSALAQSGPKKALAFQDFPSKGERILLVEDAQEIRRVATRALERNGYVVWAAENATEATRLFDQHQREIDMVFSDVVLPDGNGVDLIKQFLDRRSDLQVLLSSGYTEKKSQWAIIQQLGYPFLPKPYALADLLRVVREVIDRPQ